MKNTNRNRAAWPIAAMAMLFLMFMGQGLSAQSISGPTNVNQGSTQYYNIYHSGIIWTSWTAYGGTVTSSSTTSATINWTSAGSNSVSANFQDSYNYYYRNLSVTVNSTAPSTPPTPTVTKYCGYTRLTRATPPSGVTYYWQSSSTGTSTSNSSSYVDRTSGSTYYLRARNSSGTWSSSSASVSYSIDYKPGTPLSPTVTQNNCGNTLLTRQNPSPSETNVAWYWQSSASGTSVSYPATTMTVTSGTIYYLRARNTVSNCWSDNASSVSYVVHQVPSTPATPTVTNNCGNTVLTRTNPPSGTTWYWQSSSSGTSTSDSNSTKTLDSAGTYYLRARNDVGQCWSTASASVAYTVKNVPSEPTAPTVTNNCGNTVLTRGTPPSGTTWYWQSSSTGTSTGNSSTTATRTGGTEYYLKARDNSSLCWSTTEVINYTINPVPTTPTGTTVINNCGSTVLTRGTPPAGITWYWQSTYGGTDPSDSNTTKALSSGTTYYLKARDNTTLCWGSAETISYTVNPGPTWYADTDGDGFGDSNSSLRACTRPAGYVENADDQCISTSGKYFGCTTGSSLLGAYTGVTKSDENYIYTRSYQSAMADESGIATNGDVIEQISYFDGLGRPIQDVAIKASGEGMTPFNVKSNISEWSMDWTAGSGSTNFFNRNGTVVENLRVDGSDPHGRISLLWECGNEVDYGSDGGWSTDYFNVDKNATYRYTTWVKRTHSQDGKTYHGTQNADNLSGGANSNPYFWYGDLPQLDTWYLMVGIVHPTGYSGGDTGVSGVYDLQGTKVLDGTEFMWGSATTTSRFRSYLYYATDVSVRQYFHEPVVQKMDGSEDVLSDIINGTKGTDDLEDIVTHVGYDEYGRQDKDWLPYREATGNLGSYRGDVSDETQSYYLTNYADDFTGMVQADVNAYSEKDFESSPLNRILEQGAPGKDWKLGNNNEIGLGYSANGTSEVRRYDVTTSLANNTYTPTLVANGYYVADELYKNVTYDENYGTGTDHSTEEYKDKQGKVLLKRTYENSVAHDTYYVYDNFGNLTYVIPPKVDTSDGVSTTELDELCYRYVYDHKNRLVEKKIPGKGWEYIVYNKLDQPIMTQDANMADDDQWSFTLYDAFGRLAYSGMDLNNTSGRTTLQNAADGATKQYVTKTVTSNTYSGTVVYYSKDAYPTSFEEVHTVNYYDNYTFDLDGLSVPLTVQGQSTISGGSLKGLATGSKVRVLGTTDWITTISGYDNKRRPIYTASRNDYLEMTDVAETELDFAGKAVDATTTHTKDGNSAIVSTDSFDYDSRGRLKRQQQTIGSYTETITENSYDDLGQLAAKETGGGLQTVDYTYNVRGWLKQINDPGSLGSDLFGFAINYNTQDHGGTALFNGNIAETEWKTANDNTLRWYKYGYDALNRIEDATGSSTNYSLTGVTYDKNGNILTLDRNGHTNSGATTFGVMDDLSYSYDSGNKLLKVTDAATIDGFGFKDDAVNTAPDSTDDYTYDLNGNMTADTNKDISAITYNHLNLPTQVTINSDNITYIYDATGTKLKKTVSTGGTTEYAGNYVYEDPGSGAVLQFFNHAEGYVEPDGSGGYNYIYQYKDHLGNIRLSYTDADGDGHISDTGIFNDGFESASGWTGISAYDNTFSYSGDYSGKIVKTTSGEKVIHSDTWVAIDNASATDYTFSGWFYSDGPSIDLFLFMKTATETGYYTNISSIRDYTTNQWVYIEKTVSVPSNIAKLNLRIDNNGSGTVWFDDVRIELSGSEIVEENNYYPFGLKHKGYNNNVSSLGNSAAKKYKYNGKELQDELDLNIYDYGARNYDPAIARWWQIDPLSELMRRFTPYNYTWNNPIIYVDPDGMFAGPPTDFYDENGNRVGTDGVDDGKVVVVTDRAEARSIKRTDRAGGTTQVSDVSSGVELPSASTRASMAAAVDRTEQPTTADMSTDPDFIPDTEGNFHEEGGIYGTDRDGNEVVANAQPGNAADLNVVDEASINTNNLADGQERPYDTQGTFHTHPGGEIKSGATGANQIGSVTTKGFANPPSNKNGRGDVPNAAGSALPGPNVVLSAGNKKVYIYNKGGVIAKFPLREFRSIGNGNN